MDPYKEKLVSAWTYKSINFHQNTTNRVEGTHARIKSLLRGHRNSLLELVLFVEQLVHKQYTAIKHKFEESLRKQFKDHKSQPLVEGLCKKVSIYAINLVMVEINRLENWSKSYGGACGCQLFTSCGLPCVCRIAEIDRKGQQISLDSIHPFWKKLDFVPSSSGSQDVDTDAELEKITAWAKQTVKDSPQPVKRSLFHKLKEILTPGSNTKKPPVVVKNTRGRPTKKEQQERTEQAARVSSYTSSVQNEPESSYVMSRHSSYVSSKRPSYSENGASNNRYGKQIPKVFHPYISDINDVIPDGHCGFRCVSQVLFDNQHKHLYIRNQLLKELEGNGSIWRHIFDREQTGHYDNLYNRIHFSGPGSASETNWMDMPECGFLVANLFQIIVISIDIRGSSTIFPMNLGPVEYEEPLVAPIVYVNDGHFILLTLRGSYPMPPVDPRWTANRSDDAARWEDQYIDRIEDYARRVFPRHDPNVTPDVVFL